MKYPIGDDTNIWKWVPCELGAFADIWLQFGLCILCLLEKKILE